MIFILGVSSLCNAQYNTYKDYYTNYYGISKEDRGENGVIVGMNVNEYIRECNRIKNRGVAEIVFGTADMIVGGLMITTAICDGLMDTFELEDEYRLIGIGVGSTIGCVGIGLLIGGIVNKSKAEMRLRQCYLGLSKQGIGFEVKF